MKNVMHNIVAQANSWDSWLSQLKFGKEGEGLVQLVTDLLNSVVGVVALIAVVMLIWNGVQYITAGGDDGKVEKATKGITNAVIGLVIAFIAGLIVRFVISTILQGSVSTQ